MTRNNNLGLNIDKKVKIIGGFTIGVLFLASLLVGYFFLAFKQISYNEFGLNQDTISQKIESKVYEKGLYHVGIFHRFIKFPKTVQKIEFFNTLGSPGDSLGPLNSRTEDGLLIHIQLAFHYRLQKDDILNLYGKFGLDYEDRFVGQARTTLRDVVSFYSAIEFFTNRTIIAESMEIDLNNDLQDMYVDIVFFQMREIDLPDEFEEALKQVQIAQQQYQIALYEQEAAIVRAETAIIEAQAQANITVLSAEADAEAFVISMEAQAKAINLTLTAEKLAYYAMGQQLNLTSSELLALLWVMAVRDHDSSLLIIGADTPILIENELNTTKSI